MRDVTVEDLVRILGLAPLPEEGGLFRETYRSRHVIDQQSLPAGYTGARSVATAIYYLIAPGGFSSLHRLRGEEMFHFYLGDPVEMLQLGPEGIGEVIVLGTDLAAGMRSQVLVPGGTWQGSKLRSGGRFALLGATMSPGFDFEDFELGQRRRLVAEYPSFEKEILELTRG